MRPFMRVALVAPVLMLPACESVSNMFANSWFSGGSGSSLNDVDDLLDQIEQVHVETVLSRQRVVDVLNSLQVVITPDFNGDPLASYARFADEVQRSQEQGRELHAAVDPMVQVADDVFDGWAEDLASFSSERMRKHSEDRLEETRKRYDAIHESIEPALQAYDDFNATVSDIALFLGHDFNTGSVAEIDREVHQLAQSALELDALLEAAQAAARDYVREAALRGQAVDVRDLPTQEPAAPAAKPAATKQPAAKPAKSAKAADSKGAEASDTPGHGQG